MRIALLYPPPWKIPARGQGPDPIHGPPKDYREGDLDPDFYQTPYGLFTLGAQAIRAGHQVKVINLSAYTWERVEEVIAALDADIFGMSCWTANRRGVALAATAIRTHHPKAHIVVGGPHATPLAYEMLKHYREIDMITLGESELSFMELIERLSLGKSLHGIAGTVYRDGNKIITASARPSISDLDTLASPHDYFDTHIVMTSRGCPWQCTFCGADTTWGRGFRGNSVEYVANSLQKAQSRLPVKMIQIKDDTFTANKKRAMEISRAIRDKKLNFLWSCDTRVDVLSDELLYEMRLAGCQRLSLGVESGSPEILKQINKKITVDDIIEATEMAKRVGIQVRYYMMLGNRGDNAKTFYETLNFLKTAKPHQYIFSCLSIYPGTLDFHDAEKAGWLKREAYFTEDFQELKTPFDASEADTKIMSDWFRENSGLREYYQEGENEYRSILNRLGDYHAAHMDLAGALYKADKLDEAEQHVQKALEFNYPLPGLAYNYLGCIAYARGDIQGMQKHFMTAAKIDPQHYVLIQNVNAARAWFAQNGPERGLPLHLAARHDFQLLERTVQPTLPGPLPPDFAKWDAPLPAPEKGRMEDMVNQPMRSPEVQGSAASFDGKTRLRVV